MRAVQTPVEVRYEGTVVGSAKPLGGSISDGGTMFLATLDPLPVGTKLEVTSGGETLQLRVVRVSEGLDNHAAGMIVRAVGASGEIEIPAPPPASADAPGAPAMPATPATPVRAPAPRPLSHGYARTPTPPGSPSRSTMPGAIPSYVRPPTPAVPPRASTPSGGSPAAPARVPTPGGVLPPQNTVKGEITISPSKPVSGEIHVPARGRAAEPPQPAKDQDQRDDNRGGVPEPVAAESSKNGTGSAQIEVSGMVETGGSTADLPSLGGNGAGNKRRRSRRSRR
jgi:hypothetical protein